MKILWKENIKLFTDLFEEQYKKSNYFLKKTEKFNDDNTAMNKCTIQPKKHSKENAEGHFDGFPFFFFFFVPDDLILMEYWTYYEKETLSYLPICLEVQYKKSNYYIKETE